MKIRLHSETYYVHRELGGLWLFVVSSLNLHYLHRPLELLSEFESSNNSCLVCENNRKDSTIYLMVFSSRYSSRWGLILSTQLIQPPFESVLWMFWMHRLAQVVGASESCPHCLSTDLHAGERDLLGHSGSFPIYSLHWTIPGGLCLTFQPRAEDFINRVLPFFCLRFWAGLIWEQAGVCRNVTLSSGCWPDLLFWWLIFPWLKWVSIYDMAARLQWPVWISASNT